MRELDDFTLQRAKRGDRAALAALVRHHAPVVYALSRRLAQPSRAEDLTQEILMKVVAAVPAFTPAGPAKLSTWILTIAHRHLVDESRRKSLALVSLDEANEVAEFALGPDGMVQQLEARQAIELAIRRLPDAYRRAFVLAVVMEQPLESVAEAEDVPLGTVKSRLHRARAALVHALGPLLDRQPAARSIP